MLTMQAFHANLRAKNAEQDVSFKNLIRMTRCSLAQLEAVKSEMIWEIRGVEASLYDSRIDRYVDWE